MVPACSSGTLTNVLPRRNVMPQTQNMTPHPVTVPISMSWIRPDLEILRRPSTHTYTHTHTSERSTDSGKVVVSQKLDRKCTVPTGS